MSRKYKSIGVNAILNAIKTGLSIIFPLITYPYAFRILHTENIGKVNFSSSIVGYFALIATLGYSSYAVREGAKIRDDKEKINNFASQIFSMNLLTTIVAYVLLFVCVFALPRLADYKMLIVISSMSILLTTLSIEWVNTIYEDYLFITIRSVIAQLIILVLMFIVVRNEDDYLKYAMLGNLSSFVVCILNYFYCQRYVKIKFTFKIDIKKHLKPIFLLFANAVATTIYVNSDITMLGWISGDYSVGIYSVAVKIYTVMKNVVSAIYTVAIPRISYYVGKNEVVAIKHLYSLVVSRVLLFLLPASAGIICTAREIIMFMGGIEYTDGIVTLQILAISLVGAILGGLITYCFNIPTGKEKYNMEATTISAIINIGLNCVLLQSMKQNGAALTTMISEFFVFVYCFARNKNVRKYVDWNIIKKNLFHAVIGILTIIGISACCHVFIKNYLISMIAIILLSVITYFVELVLLNNELAIYTISVIKRKLS